MSLITPAKLAEALESFLKTFKDKSGKLKYRLRLSQMVSIGSKSLVVDFEDLLMHNSDIANRLRNEPDDVLPSFIKATYEALRVENPDYAERIRKDIQVRIRNLTDRLSLRLITVEHLDKLVSVNGMVVRASELKPLAMEAAFRCTKGHTTKVPQSGIILKKPSRCSEASCKSVKFELDIKNTVFVDYQIIRLQELPEELPPGQLPQAFDVSLQGDIVNSARPGDRIILTGIVRAEAEYSQAAGKLRLFRSKMEGNYVEVLGKEPELIQITKEDEELIHSIISQPGAYERLIESVAPTIHGYETQKEAILLLVAGSPQRVMPDGTTIRGDLNVLLVGDPGTAKSELLKYSARIAPRGLYTSGRGSTAAGLTAAVVRERTGMMMLEAGAVVLADQGIACVAGETELYIGDSLIKVEDLWEKAIPFGVTESGREVRLILTPVASFRQNKRVDVKAYARKIIRRKYNGELIEITLSSGLRLRLTPEHLVRRATAKPKWIKAESIKSGDTLKSPKRLYGPTLTLPINESTGYLLGCIYGDGYVTPYGITISQSMKSNSDVIEQIKRVSLATFSLYSKKEKEKRLGNYILISHDAHLWTSNKELIELYYNLLKPTIDRVLEFPNQALAAFLAGVFDTDGDVNLSHGKIVAVRFYPSEDEHDLAVLLYALRRFGIKGAIRKSKKGFPLIQITGQDIIEFLRLISKHSAKAKRYASHIIKHYKKIIPSDVELVKEVKRVHYDGYVYDLTVSRFHNFCASLIYIHNCIDEFDKMRPEDRNALHEMMEQQTVSVAKGGIVATLNARTSILAASNPILGKYDPYRNIADNLNLPIPLLTRFDLIFVLRDIPDRAKDEQLARHVLELHRKGEYVTAPPVDFNLLRKYIVYAKKFQPVLTKEAEEKLLEYYLEMRKIGSEFMITVTPRQLESLIRLATARARIMLRDKVTEEDAIRAISLMRRMLETVGVDVKTGKIDLGVLHGRPLSERTLLETALDIFKTLEGPQKNPVEGKAFIDELVKTGKFTQEEAQRMLQTLNRSGQIYEVKPGFYRKL
ncbi:MAG: LAGLIDADG family homing endonuclease [Nitrososphaerales archaeon]